MSTITFIVAYLIGMTTYLYLHRPPRAPRLTHRRRTGVRRTIDLRTGLEHPTRNAQGKFISKSEAWWKVAYYDTILRRDEQRALSKPNPYSFISKRRMSRLNVYSEYQGIYNDRGILRTIDTLPF